MSSCGSVLSRIGPALRNLGLEPDPHFMLRQCVSQTFLCALVVIGILAVTGACPGAHLGWGAVGVGAGLLIINLTDCTVKKRFITFVPATLAALTFIAIGSMGGVEFLANTQLGWGVIGIVLATECLFYSGSAGLSALKKRQQASMPNFIDDEIETDYKEMGMPI